MSLSYRRSLVFFLLIIIMPGGLKAAGLGETWQSLSKEDKAITLNLGVASFITLWGVANWDYFQTAPKTTSEGWFGRNTGEGGADKMGHAYSSYVVSHALSATYRKWGFERDDAMLYGSLSAVGIQTYMEIGDSFSKYGFSYEDFVANIAGGLAGYLTLKYPKLGEKIDFRAEYVPSFKSADILTAYEDYKYLLAFKLEGFEPFRDGPLSYLELHVGYYTRGYDNQIPIDDERNFYVGIGINLSRIARQNGFNKLGTFLNYYQVPYTYAPIEHDFND